MRNEARAAAAAFGLLLFATAFSQGRADQASPPAPRQSALQSAGDNFYRQYRYRLRYNGRVVAGFNEMSSSPATHMVGHTKYESVTLERGVTRDSQFAQWAGAVAKSGNVAPPASSRRNISVVLYDEAGRAVQRFSFTQSWVSQYSALPDLNANANAVLIQHIIIEAEGWEIDGTPSPKP